ncbi:MAG: DUF1858 domain-containing protein [Eubacterium sp.]|nr:DUF1858 domain-containing protein [Eubacterium sp.]
MNINRDTKLADLFGNYPWLIDELATINDKFKMVKTPMGKIMLKKATIAEMCKKSGMDEATLISEIEKRIERR